MRREGAGVDSIAYQAMFSAYSYKDSALRASQHALAESERISQDYAGMYHESDKAVSGLKKEVRRQKRLKVLTLIGAGIVLLLSLH